MPANAVEALGLLAGALTTGAYIPQLLRIMKTGDTRAISATTYGTLSIGIALWLGYGVLVKSLSVTLWNAVALAVTIPILVLKIRNDF